MKRSKREDQINKFISLADESYEGLYTIYLPSSKYDGCLKDEYMCDIIGAYLDDNDGFRLSFLISDPNTGDRDQAFVSFGSLPFSVQKQLITDFNQQ